MNISQKIKKISVLLMFPILSHAQDNIHHFQPISITASRLTTSLAAETRQLDMLTREEILLLPVSTVSEAIQYMNGVDLQQRGTGGVQADFSLRGSGFEQVLILLNGVRINDPQTGHYNSDIPISLADVDRIEVLHGHASSMFGPDGYGGVINIITRKAESNQSAVSLNGGSFKTIHTRFSQSLKIGNISTRWHLERRGSDGYRPVTDYKIISLSNTSEWEKRNHTIQLNAGIIDKDFGANGFYADYPSREKTRSVLGILGYQYQPHQHFQWSTQFHVRQHNDVFILDHENPDWYRNDHVSRSLGVESTLRFLLINGFPIAVGSEFLTETLQSSSLGTHFQKRFGIFGEFIIPFPNGTINSGIRLDVHEHWGTQISPSLNIGYKILESLKWRAACGRIFRAPTFTELYYKSPANIGNPDLRPENGWNIETGLDGYIFGLSYSITGFQRTEKDRIDWIAETRNDPWKAVNLGALKSTGISFAVSQHTLQPISWAIDYTYLNQNQNRPDYLSKYQFHVLHHHVNVNMAIYGPWQMIQSCNIIWKHRQDDTAYWYMSLKWSRNFNHVRIFVEGRNLLDTDYQEIIDVPMPGRNFMAGLEVKWDY